MNLVALALVIEIRYRVVDFINALHSTKNSPVALVNIFHYSFFCYVLVAAGFILFA